MSERNSFADRKRALEEEYFRRKEHELLERKRRGVELGADRKRMAEALVVVDQEILQGLQDLGYTGETVNLLYLAPLVQVAWAEGEITERERRLIFEAAGLRGVKEASRAFQQLSEWLDRRPPEEFFNQTLRLIAAMWRTLPPDERDLKINELVSDCSSIAKASGGIMGFVKLGRSICREEEEILVQIAAELKRSQA